MLQLMASDDLWADLARLEQLPKINLNPVVVDENDSQSDSDSDDSDSANDLHSANPGLSSPNPGPSWLTNPLPDPRPKKILPRRVYRKMGRKRKRGRKGEATTTDSPWDSDSDSANDLDAPNPGLSSPNPGPSWLPDPVPEPRPKTKSSRRVSRKPGQKRRGRPSWIEKYTELAEIVQQVLNSQPSAADRARSETTNYTTLTVADLHRQTCESLRQHLIDFGLPVPKKLLGPKTVRRIGLPANRGVRAAKYYKGAVHSRTAHRDINATTWHPDFHYTAATVKIFSEMSSFFEADCVLLSCDNKNKIGFGVSANANLTRPLGVYLSHNLPSLPDHSFPTKHAKIVPMGYMTVAGRLHGRARHSSLQYRTGLQYVFYA